MYIVKKIDILVKRRLFDCPCDKNYSLITFSCVLAVTLRAGLVTDN